MMYRFIFFVGVEYSESSHPQYPMKWSLRLMAINALIKKSWIEIRANLRIDTSSEDHVEEVSRITR